MAMLIKQSTSIDVAIGPFLDETDGKTAETGLTLTQPDIRLKKNGGAWAQKAAAQTLSHEEAGWYELTLDATDTGTLGQLIVAVHESGALPVWREFCVVPANVWDALVGGTDVFQVHAVEISNDLITAAAIAANAITSSEVADDAIDAGAIAADAIGASELAASAIGESEIAANAITSSEVADDAIDAGALAAGAIGASELATDAIGAAELADDAIDAGAIAAGAIGASEIATDAIGSAEVADGAIDAGAIAADAIGASEVADGAIDAGAIAADAIGASEIATDAIGSSELATTAGDEIADETWDEALSGHLGAGSTGEALDGAGGGGGGGATAAEVADAVWDEALSAHQSAGSTGLALSGASGAAGSGALTRTLGITVASLPVQGAAIWVSTDTGGSSIVAGPLITDSFGEVTVLLDAGTYYVWIRKDGMNPVVGQVFAVS